MLHQLLRTLKLEPFVLAIFVAVVLASFFPAVGTSAQILEYLTHIFIILLFFMHGAKLSRSAIIGGFLHWRLHLLVMIATFVFFPLMAFILMLLPDTLLPPPLLAGFIYLCAMPSTVQSSIAFTSKAGGNVSAAVCSASFSSILGVFLSPIIVAMMLNMNHEMSFDISNSIGKILLMLLLPFILGHLSRPLIGQWIEKHRSLVKFTDNSSIILIVYAAFSAAVVNHLWQLVSWQHLVLLIVLSCLLLLGSLSFTSLLAKRFKFSLPDQIAIVFCGSKKSLANGVPMANILFPANQVGMIILPLMIFHQIQLIVCSFIASHYRKKTAMKD